MFSTEQQSTGEPSKEIKAEITDAAAGETSSTIHKAVA